MKKHDVAVSFFIIHVYVDGIGSEMSAPYVGQYLSQENHFYPDSGYVANVSYRIQLSWRIYRSSTPSS
jgi:hypothetical protein